MDPASLVLVFLQNDARTFRARFELTEQTSLQPGEHYDSTPRYNTRLKYVIGFVPLLGAGLVAAVVFLRNSDPTGAIIAHELKSSAPTCHYMRVSLLPGGKLSAKGELSKGVADMDCTKTMSETSSLCREACTSYAP